MYYELNLFTQTVNAQGEKTDDSKSFTFKNDNILTARREAISKAKALEEELDSNSAFLSPTQAVLKDFKDYSSYSMTITFFNEDNDGTIIYGEQEEEVKQGLISEFNSYMRKGIEIQEIDMETEDDTYEVIEEDIQYLLQ